MSVLKEKLKRELFCWCEKYESLNFSLKSGGERKQTQYERMSDVWNLKFETQIENIKDMKGGLMQTDKFILKISDV